MGVFLFGRIFVLVAAIWITNNSAQRIGFVEEPKSAEVYEGSNINLNCIFTQPVSECFWKKNEFTVLIDGRYEYVSNKERNTNDCSIKINKCEAEYDNGMWQCGQTNGLMSQVIRLTIHSKEIAFTKEPTDVAVHLTGIGTLECILRLPVKKCHWKRNGQSVWIDKRYQYMVGNGKDTTRCTVLITDARLIDNGTWQCAVYDYENEMELHILSREATFHVKPVFFIKEPLNKNVKDSDDLILDCVFSHTVSECYWKRNGLTVSIRGRYQYLTGNGLDAYVCSIAIYDVQITDNGTWQCSFYGNEKIPGLLSREAILKVKTDKPSTIYDESYGNYITIISIVCLLSGSSLTLISNRLLQYWIKRKMNGSMESGLLESLLEHKSKQRNSRIVPISDGIGKPLNDEVAHETIIWKIDGFRSKKDEASRGKNNILSDSYCICLKGCHVKFRILFDALPCLYQDKLSMGLFFKFLPDARGYIRDHVLDHEISFTVRDLTGDKTITQIEQPAYGKNKQEQWKTGWNGNHIFAAESLFNEDGQYIKGDKLKVEICIRDLISVYDEFASDDGIHHWIINDYTSKRNLESVGFFEKLVSEPFHTSARGYRMRAFLYLNGSFRNGTHIELQLMTYRGKYDAELPRAFAHVRKVMIMPVDENAEPIVQTTVIDPSMIGDDEAEAQMGKPKKAFVIPHHRVENHDYINNDKLHIKIEIKSLDEGL